MAWCVAQATEEMFRERVIADADGHSPIVHQNWVSLGVWGVLSQFAMGVVAVILAAGSGSRMKSTLPKVLHPVCGLPMIEARVPSGGKRRAERLIVVISPDNGEAIRG